MSANLENSAVATGLEKVSFHSNPKEKQCQRMFKLLYNCTHFTCQQGNAQSFKLSFNSMWTKNFQIFKLDLEKAEEREIKLPKSIGSQNKEGHLKKSTSASLARLKPLTVWITTNWKILKEMRTPDHLTCLLRNLYAGQEATVRIRHGTANWLSPWLFNLYAEYIIWNARLDDSQAGVKIAGRNINNLKYADDTTLMAKSEEELKSLLMKVKEES